MGVLLFHQRFVALLSRSFPPFSIVYSPDSFASLTMLATLRRCPASLVKNLSSAGLSSKVVRGALSQSSSITWRTTTRVRPVAIATFHHSARWQEAAAAADEASINSEGPVTRFDDLKTRGLVHPNVVDTITKMMKLHDMTEVQTRTINEALSGNDM